jgi:hypothetical protein
MFVTAITSSLTRNLLFGIHSSTKDVSGKMQQSRIITWENFLKG